MSINLEQISKFDLLFGTSYREAIEDSLTQICDSEWNKGYDSYPCHYLSNEVPTEYSVASIPGSTDLLEKLDKLDKELGTTFKVEVATNFIKTQNYAWIEGYNKAFADDNYILEKELPNCLACNKILGSGFTRCLECEQAFQELPYCLKCGVTIANGFSSCLKCKTSSKTEPSHYHSHYHSHSHSHYHYHNN